MSTIIGLVSTFRLPLQADKKWRGKTYSKSCYKQLSRSFLRYRDSDTVNRPTQLHIISDCVGFMEQRLMEDAKCLL